MATEVLFIFWGNRFRALVHSLLMIYPVRKPSHYRLSNGVYWDIPNRSSERRHGMKVQGRERRWGVSISRTEEMKGMERGISCFRVSSAKASTGNEIVKGAEK
jgi:hypothetical protein